ncbi:MAG: DNA-directed RNA polymerase [Nitrososphaeria archaeon]|nr:DNA-directed RNA polymerase [Aigarchaeota archaeon]MCX8187217.1 DNA-directed RNA polymerase [Nitrososphaeria archaeon]MDW8021698.1 DNA-directed RNA polymerase [Nitrososphaerota archaeon]
MFILTEIEDVVAIPPRDFGKPLKKVALERLREGYEGKILNELGYVVMIVDVEVDPIGILLPRDGSTYHRAKAKLLCFYPRIQEVGEGEVVEITEFGAFIRVGPLDALLHISQIMDDYITYDERHSILTGKKTGRKLEVGDDVRFRVVAVSLTHGTTGKVGVTTRQPYLGKIEWIREGLEKEAPRPKKAEAVAGGK